MPQLVSIIIPTFNRAKLIGETLNSVLAQTHQNWECIVVDDGSTDSTEKLMQIYCEKDSRIKFHKRSSVRIKGANTCRNIGFELSKGEYIQWLDSDDLLAQNKIQSQLESIKYKDILSLATCKFGYFISIMEKSKIRENISTYKNFNVGQKLLYEFGICNEYFPSHVYLSKRELIVKSGLWDESLSINQDGEFFTRILLMATSINFVNTYVYYRMGRNQNVSEVNSPIRAQKLIDSWKLIQIHIQDVNGEKKHPYLERAKRKFYNQFNMKYPEIIKENYFFLKSVIPLHKRLIHKIF